MNRIPITLVLVLLSIIPLYPQVRSEPNKVGTTYHIDSKFLNEERTIQVHLPEGYEASEENYPVLYLLDGQRLFLLGVSMQQSMAQFEQTPEFIVVGIHNTYPQRFGHFTSSTGDFRQFLVEEVVGFVDENFRTHSNRLLFGWEYGGAFAIHTMLEQPKAFNSYLAASPFPLESQEGPKPSGRLKILDSLLQMGFSPNVKLYFTADTTEGMVANGATSLSQMLTKQAPESLNWEYRMLNGEEHRSTAYATLYKGLRFCFQFYPELQFNTLKDFNDAGGLPNVYEYYSTRSQQYGFAEALTGWTMFSIVRNAMRANNFVQFDELVKEFQPKGFLQMNRLSRACSVAAFYAENQKYDRAIELYTLLQSQNPTSSLPVFGLAEIYKAYGEQDKYEEYQALGRKLSEAND